jgi:hypothetical protein
VSRLSNKLLRLEVEADGLAAALSSRWPRPKSLARASQAWVAPAADAQPGHSQPSIQPAFAATFDRLCQELTQTASLPGAALDVELADALVHFDVLEGEFVGHGEAQLAKLIRACARDVLGESGDEHELRWQLQADEKHLLMCAVPAALLKDLRAGAARHRLRLRRVQPRFPLRWNRHNGLLRSGLGVFASGHDDHAVIAFVRNGVVEALSTGSCPAELEDPNSPAPSVDRLLNSLGLEKTATPTRLDAQVDRLIASLGVDAKQLGHFVAVDGGRNGQALSSRWQLYDNDVAAP